MKKDGNNPPKSEGHKFGNNKKYLVKLKGYSDYKILMYVDNKWREDFVSIIEDDINIEWWVDIYENFEKNKHMQSIQYYLGKCIGLRHYLDLWLIEQNRINTTFKIFQQTGLLYHNYDTQFPEFDIWWDMNKEKYIKE